MVQVISFLKETQEELKKIVWPSKEQTARLTLMVIMVTIAVGVFIGVIDYLLSNASSWLISR